MSIELRCSLPWIAASSRLCSRDDSIGEASSLIPPECASLLGQLHGVVDAEFAHDALPVRLDGSGRAVENMGCFLTGPSLKEQSQDLGFRVRDRFTREGHRSTSLQGIPDGG